MKTFSLETALDAVGGDVVILKGVSKVFLDTYADNLESIRKALDTNNPALLQASSHSLKGSLLVFGAEEARSLAAELESCGKRGDLEGCDRVFESLKKNLLDFKSELETWVQI